MCAVSQAANEKEHGNDAFEFQQYDLALQRYTQAIEHDPYDPKIWSNRSAVYLSMGRCASRSCNVLTLTCEGKSA